eukprot:GHVQ01026734.1.p1 GENE.GHVQ01026734.1~~GHVQ01026734.1.p1  ORF type:complete len:438 (-),score=68.44 GHVQ01026734.1:13-1326(-)
MSRTMWNNKSPLLYSSLLLANFIFVLFASFLLLLLSSSSSSCYAAHAEVYSAVIEEVTEGIGLSPTAARGAYEGGEVVMSSTAVMGQQHKSVKERRRAVHTDVSDLTASSSSSTLSFTHPSRRMMITSDDQNVGFLFNFMRISKEFTLYRLVPVYCYCYCYVVIVLGIVLTVRAIVKRQKWIDNPKTALAVKSGAYFSATIVLAYTRYKYAPPPPPSVAVKDSVMSRYPWCVFIDLIATFTAFMSVEHIFSIFIPYAPSIYDGILIDDGKADTILVDGGFHSGKFDNPVKLHLKLHRDLKDIPEMREAVRDICKRTTLSRNMFTCQDRTGTVPDNTTEVLDSLYNPRRVGLHLELVMMGKGDDVAIAYVAPFKAHVTTQTPTILIKNVHIACGTIDDLTHISVHMDVDDKEKDGLKSYLRKVGVMGEDRGSVHGSRE